MATAGSAAPVSLKSIADLVQLYTSQKVTHYQDEIVKLSSQLSQTKLDLEQSREYRRLLIQHLKKPTATETFVENDRKKKKHVKFHNNVSP